VWGLRQLLPTLLVLPGALQVLHFAQLYQTGRCQLFDYGSSAANMSVYQQSSPPLVSDSYQLLRGVPVHLVSGLHDGVIPPGNVILHYQALKAAGVDVSYRQVGCPGGPGGGDAVWRRLYGHKLKLTGRLSFGVLHYLLLALLGVLS
jgi:hypothetical protein